MLTPLQGAEGIQGGKGGESSRITEVDILRGFALFGISIVNTVGISKMPTVDAEPGAAYWAYETLLHQRFFPIFSFLFGLSFGLFLDSVRDRVNSPRFVMLARLGFLVPFGALHRILQPDEVLLSYAVIGIAVLLPASFLPMRWVAVLGGGGTLLGVALGGGSLIIPGIFLVGLSVQRYGFGALANARVSRMLSAWATVLSLALALDVWQIGAGVGSRTPLAAAAGMMTAAAYVVGIMLLVRTRGVGRLGGLAAVGRMALTGYVGATVLILATGHFINLGEAPRYGVAFSLGACVFAAELAFSVVWLRWARYGPLEWLWRCLTWWRIVPIRKSSGA
ncbi:DUF418 domain-containing protein [Actinomadura monticuli]|uniref:DUF418 domain-containing protein n=1 Tax=Actinomadura monticuli TaxID=3097367 RepID=A0ABV4QA02_9ACTN